MCGCVCARVCVLILICFHAPTYLFAFAEAAYDEIEILNVVAAEEQRLGYDARVVRIIDSFFHRGPHGKRTFYCFEWWCVR